MVSPDNQAADIFFSLQISQLWITPGISGRPLFALRWMPLFGAAGAIK
jgi:hypothetical protein